MTENRADYLLAVAIEMRMTARGMRYPEARHQTELEEEALPFEVIVAAWAENTATRA
jgi:hypothetical protein